MTGIFEHIGPLPRALKLGLSHEQAIVIDLTLID